MLSMTFRQQRQALEAFAKTLDQESFVLKENPELTFPQLYNRLKWRVNDNDCLQGTLDSERKRFKKPWFSLITKPEHSAALMRSY